MDFKLLEQNFKKNKFKNEDDIKIHFHSDIVKPILLEVNPSMSNEYRSENILLAGGRTDATFQNIYFELKKLNRFLSNSGIQEALFGRDDKDHGLYDYILSGAEIKENDSEEEILNKITKGIGIGFDGDKFIFARFIPSTQKTELNTNKININIPYSLNLQFYYEIKDFSSGLKRLALLLKQQEKRALTKQNILSVINTKSDFVRNSILETYKEIDFNLNDLSGSDRVRTLFREWDRVFGMP